MHREPKIPTWTLLFPANLELDLVVSVGCLVLDGKIGTMGHGEPLLEHLNAKL